MNGKKQSYPKNIRIFNKRNHLKEKWMTSELLTHIVKKKNCILIGKLLLSLMFKEINSDLKNMKTLKPMQDAKTRYFDRIFAAYKTDIEKTW